MLDLYLESDFLLNYAKRQNYTLENYTFKVRVFSKWLIFHFK